MDKTSIDDKRQIRDAMSTPALVLWINNRIVDLHMEMEDGMDDADYKMQVGRIKELRNLQDLPKSMAKQLKGKETEIRA